MCTLDYKARALEHSKSDPKNAKSEGETDIFDYFMKLWRRGICGPAPQRCCIASQAKANMRSISMVFVLLFLAWQPASAEDSKQPTNPNRESLGVTIRQINDETAQILGVQPPRGAIVIYVVEKSPAKRAGIVLGDVIVKLNGIDIKELSDVPRAIADVPAGKSTPVALIREGKEIAATVLFGMTARVRIPTCDELFSYANWMPPDAIDRSFSKGNGNLSVNDFDDALAVVSRCREAVAPPPLDRRHVPTERNGRFQLNVLSLLAQGLRISEKRNAQTRTCPDRP